MTLIKNDTLESIKRLIDSAFELSAAINTGNMRGEFRPLIDLNDAHSKCWVDAFRALTDDLRDAEDRGDSCMPTKRSGVASLKKRSGRCLSKKQTQKVVPRSRS